MLGAHPPHQIHNSTKNGPRIKISQSEIPFVSLHYLLYPMFFTLVNKKGTIQYKSYDLMCYHCICLHSVSVPTKPRFSDSSHRRILHEVQHQRPYLVHEQWQFFV